MAKSRLTKELIETLANHVNAGMTLELAASMPGVNVTSRTLRNYFIQGENDIAEGKTNTLHAKLVQKCANAHSQVYKRCLDAINKCVDNGDWRAAFALLKSIPNSPYRVSAGRPPQVTVHTGPVTGDMLLQASPAYRLQVIQRHRERMGLPGNVYDAGSGPADPADPAGWNLRFDQERDMAEGLDLSDL